MKITEITIVQGYGPDNVLLNTDLPEPTYPRTGRLFLQFSAEAGTGIDYCARHWPNVPARIINRVTTGSRRRT